MVRPIHRTSRYDANEGVRYSRAPSQGRSGAGYLRINVREELGAQERRAGSCRETPGAMHDMSQVSASWEGGRYAAGPSRNGLAGGIAKSRELTSWHFAPTDKVAWRAVHRSLSRLLGRFRARGAQPDFKALRCANSSPASVGHSSHLH